MSIYREFCKETVDDNGRLTDIGFSYPDNFNFGYDVVDRIAAETPDKCAMVWCNTESEEHIFSFEDSLKVNLAEERMIPLWFCDQEVLTKYYTVEDVLNTLTTIGFRVRGIEEVEGDGIIHAVSFDCTL